MIKSMTGYGRSVKNSEVGEVTVEVRSLNNRFIDVYLKAPEILSDFEDEFKKYIAEKLRRGSVKVVITLSLKGESDVEHVHLNVPLMKKYYNELLEAKKELGIRGKVDLEHVLKIANYFELTVPNVDSSKFYEPVKSALEAAISELIDMRAKEGEHIAEQMKGYLDVVETRLSEIRKIYEVNREKIIEKFRNKILELISDLEIDESRIIQEAGILSKKIDITEECDRLVSHIFQFRRFLESDTPVGKKMVFLIQEMNREVTTIGSKSEDARISHLVVEIKDALEKLREQAQNIL